MSRPARGWRDVVRSPLAYVGVGLAVVIGGAVAKERADTYAALPTRVSTVEHDVRTQGVELAQATRAIKDLTATIVEQEAQRRESLEARRAELDAEAEKRRAAEREREQRQTEVLEGILGELRRTE